jgi:hypothetical protein
MVDRSGAACNANILPIKVYTGDCGFTEGRVGY